MRRWGEAWVLDDGERPGYETMGRGLGMRLWGEAWV